MCAHITAASELQPNRTRKPAPLRRDRNSEKQNSMLFTGKKMCRLYHRLSHWNHTRKWPYVRRNDTFPGESKSQRRNKNLVPEEPKVLHACSGDSYLGRAW